MRMIKKLMFLVGVVLFITNIIGVLLPLRNEQIYSEQNTGFKDDIVLNEHQLWEEINSDSSDISAYISSTNTSVNKGIAHYWRDEGIEKYNLRIPFYENYFLYIASWLYPSIYEKYEFSGYKRAIERGVGLCSQHAIIISGILKDKGIQSKIVGLSGHVIATAAIDREAKQWWILDPDYGVVIPYSIDSIESDPNIITPYYSRAGFNVKQVEVLVDIYGAEGNKVRGYQGLKYYIENFTYVMKWLLPLLLVIPYGIWVTGDGKQKTND